MIIFHYVLWYRYRATGEIKHMGMHSRSKNGQSVRVVFYTHTLLLIHILKASSFVFQRDNLHPK
jgi:hypothetical protein